MLNAGIDVERFAKVWALTDSDIPGEAAAARSRAAAMLKRAGKTLADAPSILRQKKRKESRFEDPSYAEARRAAEEIIRQQAAREAEARRKEAAAREATYEDLRRKEHAEWIRKHAAERKKVIAGYGSVEAALVRTREEKLLFDAVSQWVVYQQGTDERWIESIDGIGRFSEPEGRVKKAISEAYPL